MRQSMGAAWLLKVGIIKQKQYSYCFRCCLGASRPDMRRILQDLLEATHAAALEATTLEHLRAHALDPV